MNEHFLQSDAWEKFQHALGHTTVRRSGDGWSYLAIVERGAGLIRLYCPYGPTIRSKEALDAALRSLSEEAARVGASYVRVQPQGVTLDTTETIPRHMRPIAYSQPVMTRIIDLIPPFEELLAAVSQSKRSVIRNYQKKGLVYRMSKDPADIEKLLPLIHDIAERNRISVHSDDYIRTQAQALLPDNASLHFMELDGESVSGAFLFEDATTCYYAHAGTSAKHYTLQANTALLGELLAYAKKTGKKHFDLYGIAPTDDENHPWAGLTHFKAGFGGEIVSYNQTYDVPLKKAAYAAYSLLRSLTRRRG